MQIIDPISKKLSLSKDYFLFSGILFLIILIALSWILVSSYNTLNLKRKARYINEGKKISLALNESFDYIDNFSRFLGRKIVQNLDNTPESIYKVLDSRIDPSNINNESLTHTLFDFVDPSGYVTVASLTGVLKNPIKININKRKWLDKVKNNPWQIHLADPDIGISSKEYGISVGYGIVDDNDKFMGTLSIGLSIEKLTKKIYDYVSKQDTDFVVLNDDFKLVVQSEKKGDVGNLDLIIHEAVNLGKLKNTEGFFEKKIFYNGSEYNYFVKIPNYNYMILVGQNIDSLSDEFARTIAPQIVKTVLIGLTFLVLLYFFRIKIVNPMVVLSEKAKAISRGDDNISLPKVYTMEAQNLVEALEMVKTSFKSERKMKDQLYQANSEIKEINASLEIKVEERTIELKKALAAKTEFLNNMSHEVRTPIQGIVNISQGLVDHWSGYKSAERLFFAKKVAEYSQRLISLVSNLLDLSKFGAGKMKLTLRQSDLISLTMEMIKECQDLYIIDKDIKLEFESELHTAPIKCDPDKITQVLRNLFANAIKFTPKGTISVNLSKAFIIYEDRADIEAYKLSVSDSGVGIPIGEEESIFEPFTQSTRTKTRAGGTGLGLAICKNIIKAHKGVISAKNNTTIGANFEFIIPIENSGKIAIDLVESIFNNEEIEVNEIRSKDISGLEDEYKINDLKTILLVDDEEALHFSMNMMLPKDKYKLMLASGGTEGLKMIRDNINSIDLVLLDLMMPDMYGLNVLKEIREDTSIKDIKVILQTGSNDADELERAKSLGVSNILAKPYDKRKILKLLENFFA